MKHIPVIDLSGLNDTTPSKPMQRAFFEAYHNLGFAYIVNHGVSTDLTSSVFDASRRFHALPQEMKMAIALDHKHRGYIAISTSTDVNSKVATVTTPNQSASFMMMREDVAEDQNLYLSGPNQWPDLDNFRTVLEFYSREMNALGKRLMRLALCSVGVKDLSVLSAFDPATIWLRLLHYPPVPKNSPSDVYGSAPHTDFGALTILAQDDVGGLQVKTPDGRWLDAPKLENSFVVNVGDMLHRMTNGLLKSTPHRVINHSAKERYSCPFFFDPHVSFTVAPLPETGDPIFAPLNFGEFLRHELSSAYEQHKS